MIKYLGGSGTPMFKTKYDIGTRVVPLLFWSPASSCRIVLTDLDVSQVNTGSIRISYGTSRAIMEFYLAGSARLQLKLQTPIVAPSVDWPLYVDTSVSGGIYIQAKGFEIPLY
jgi:hypothetical protein